MKGSVKNIGQKGNENRELYNNNNLKVVNHMEKNINIAASGSELETLQNQYLATKIALENNQERRNSRSLPKLIESQKSIGKILLRAKTSDASTPNPRNDRRRRYPSYPED